MFHSEVPASPERAFSCSSPDLSDRLLAAGLGEAEVRVLIGEAGSRELDQYGRHHGLLARLRRSLQSFTDERGHLEEYAWALSRGEIVVAVQLPPRAATGSVCSAFKDCGAHFVHHYGAWVVHKYSA